MTNEFCNLIGGQAQLATPKYQMLPFSDDYLYAKNLRYNFKVYGPFFMDGVRLSQGYRATTRRQFIFY